MRTLPFDHAARNLGRRPRQTLLVTGAALVVALLALTAAAFLRGIDRALARSGSSANAIVLGTGSEESVERSEVDAALPSLLEASVPGIRTRLGVPFVSPEMHLGLRVGADASEGLTLVRGVTDRAFLVHERVRIGAGRAPRPGADEVAIGRAAAGALLDGEPPLGAGLLVDGRSFTVVGVVEAPGTVVESEVWMPLADLQALARRQGLSCVVLTLDDPAAFGDLETLALRRLDLEIAALRESEYYATIQRLLAPVRALAVATAALIALAALVGSLTALHATFAGRTRELAALQVLGFRRAAILWGLVQESVLVHAIGGLVATVIALAILDGVAVDFSTGSFGLSMDATAIAVGLGTTLVLGALGAVLPALRALRPPIRDALRT